MTYNNKLYSLFFKFLKKNDIYSLFKSTFGKQLINEQKKLQFSQLNFLIVKFSIRYNSIELIYKFEGFFLKYYFKKTKETILNEFFDNYSYSENLNNKYKKEFINLTSEIKQKSNNYENMLICDIIEKCIYNNKKFNLKTWTTINTSYRNYLKTVYDIRY